MLASYLFINSIFLIRQWQKYVRNECCIVKGIRVTKIYDLCINLVILSRINDAKKFVSHFLPVASFSSSSGLLPKLLIATRELYVVYSPHQKCINCISKVSLSRITNYRHFYANEISEIAGNFKGQAVDNKILHFNSI